MPFSRPHRAALRGLLIGCCATAAAAAVLGAGLMPASGATSGRVPVPGAVSGPLPVSGAVAGEARSGAADADTTPPSAPGDLSPRNVYLNGVAGLTWTPSTDDVGVTGYEVFAWSYSTPESVSFSRTPAEINTSSPTQVTAMAHGLTPNRSYLFYVVAVDAAGNRSVPSLLTMNKGMAEPPSPSPSAGPNPWNPPSAYDLRASAGLTPGYATLTWSYDGTPGALTWAVFRRSSSEWSYAGSSSIPRTMASIGSEASYTFQVVTRDNYGYLSLPSNAATYLTPSPSPSATPVPSTCSVIYRANGWGSGFTATISLKNIGTTPINGWKLTFAFPLTTQRVTNGWSATWTQTGTDVSATDTAWNRTIQPGQTFWLGFNGSHSGNNPSPTVFKLNGNTCESA